MLTKIGFTVAFSSLLASSHAQRGGGGLRGATDDPVFTGKSSAAIAVFNSSATDVHVHHRGLVSPDEYLRSFNWMYGGVDSFQQCRGGQLVKGLCGSGKNRDCDRYNPDSYTATGCGYVDGEPSESGQTGWICVAWGQYASCPAGMIMVGACGSGQNADCRKYCDPNKHAAIKCAPLKSEAEVSFVTWSRPLDHGSYAACGGSGQAMCGACQ